MVEPVWTQVLASLVSSAADEVTPFDELDDISKPKGHTPEELRDWIEKATDALNITSTELARSAQIAPSTLNRFVAGSSKNTSISAKTIEKIASVISLALKDKNSPLRVIGNRRVTWEDKPTSGPFVKVVKVIGSLDGVNERTRTFWPTIQQYAIALPVFPSPRLRLHLLMGWEVKGFISDAFPIASVIVTTVNPEGSPAPTLRKGDHVICNIFSDGEWSLTLREYVIDPNNDGWFISRNKLGRIADRPAFVGKAQETDTIFIAGVVVGAIIPYRTFSEDMNDLMEERKRAQENI